MIARKKVYICDHCGTVDLERTYYFLGDTWKGAPDGWMKLGKEDLCPICAETYIKFRSAIEKEKSK